MPDGIEFRLGKADSDGLALAMGGTLFRSSAFLPIILIVLIQASYLLTVKEITKGSLTLRLRPTGVIFPLAGEPKQGFSCNGNIPLLRYINIYVPFEKLSRYTIQTYFTMDRSQILELLPHFYVIPIDFQMMAGKVLNKA